MADEGRERGEGLDAEVVNPRQSKVRLSCRNETHTMVARRQVGKWQGSMLQTRSCRLKLQLVPHLARPVLDAKTQSQRMERPQHGSDLEGSWKGERGLDSGFAEGRSPSSGPNGYWSDPLSRDWAWREGQRDLQGLGHHNVYRSQETKVNLESR